MTVAVTRCQVSHLPLSPWSFYALRRLATVIARLPLDTRPDVAPPGVTYARRARFARHIGSIARSYRSGSRH